MNNVLISIKNLEKTYVQEPSFLSLKKQSQLVLKGVNLDIKRGEVVSLVGESGCGKSTLANCILKLISPQKGEIIFDGKDILKFNKKETFEYRKKIQMIFQNPYSSLNPKMKIKDTLIEPLIIHKEKDCEKRIEEIILNSFIPISKKEIYELVPDVSISTIEAVLSRLIKENKIIKLGSTINAKYFKNM